jgi:heme/copper-type cytochrome/quinol oxidase subunit 3
MTDATLRFRDPLPSASAVERPAGWWGMVWLCATEASLFACLIASFFFLRGSVDAFRAGGGHYPNLKLPLVMTAVLLTSSVSMWWSERGIKAGNETQLRIGYAVTFVLGAVFLALQTIEFRANPIGPTVSAHQSIFYTTTGFHGAHVAMGLLMNLFVQLRAWRGHFSSARHLAVTNVALYWHFVDAVWIVILLSLYLSPRLW